MTPFHAGAAALLTAIALAAPSAAQDASKPRPVSDGRRAETAAGFFGTAELPRGFAVFAQQSERQRQSAGSAVRQRSAAERARAQADARRLAQQREFANWPEATEIFSRTLRLERNGTFDLQTLAGDVVITGGRGDGVRIEATKRVRHRIPAQARTALAEIQIDIAERGGNVELRTEQPRRRLLWTAVDYVISLPSSANVIVGTGSGNVRVANVSGELRANTADGNITASGVRRVRHLSTMRGNVDVSNAEADELSANTLQGDVILRNIKARGLDLNTVTGDVRLVDVQMNRARLETTAGDIEYAGPLARSGRYIFLTHSGNIRVNPLGNAGFDLEAHSFTGDIRSDYALNLIDRVATRARRAPERTLRGTFGDAAAVLTARSFSGDIQIVRK
jgi:hypothetical protein